MAGHRGEGDPTPTHLSLDDKKFESLPPEVLQLKQLRYLSLMACENLKTLPKELAELTDLRQLILMHCGALEDLPDLSGMPKLKPKEVKTSYASKAAEQWQEAGLKSS